MEVDNYLYFSIDNILFNWIVSQFFERITQRASMLQHPELITMAVDSVTATV